MSEQPLDVEDPELEGLLRELPLRPPPATLDARIAELAATRRAPRTRRFALRFGLVAALVVIGLAGGSAFAIARVCIASRQPVPPAPEPADLERRWATASDEGLVVVDGRPMRAWRLRTVVGRSHRDSARRLRITSRVVHESVTFVPQSTL